MYYGLKSACIDIDKRLIREHGDARECIGKSLYWLDLHSLIASQLKRSQKLTQLKYFSAHRRVPTLIEHDRHDEYVKSNERQSVFIDAMRTRPNTEVVLGWYSEQTPNTCIKCGHQWPRMEEKVTDVNIATHMLRDAYTERMDMAVLVTADADLVPPVKVLQELDIPVRILLMPGRKRAKNLQQVATETYWVKTKTVKKHIMPRVIVRPGLPDLVRPENWDHKPEWVWRSPAPTPWSGGLASE